MKLATLIALALLPIALGTPVPNDTSVADSQGLALWRVTAHLLNCRARPDSKSTSKIIKVYKNGEIITSPCWVEGETVNGNM